MKTKLCYFDFDGTLIDTPVASPENKEKWASYYGKPWAYKGWWGRPESLDRNVWTMEPIKEVYNDYLKYSEDPNCLMIMSTGRLESLAGLVKEILDDNELYFDFYFFNKLNIFANSQHLKKTSNFSRSSYFQVIVRQI